MSAVFLLAAAAMPHTSEGAPLLHSAMSDEVKDLIRTTAIERLDALYELDPQRIDTLVHDAWEGPTEWADGEDYREDQARGSVTYLQRAHVALADFLDLILPDDDGTYGPGEDVSTLMWFEGKPWLFVGETSWGDVPDDYELTAFAGDLDLFGEPIVVPT